jgi:putative phosphoribosyl transferase
MTKGSSKQFAMFRDREDAGRQLAQRLNGREFRKPLVMSIPRGGLVIGAIVAKALSAELDVVLTRRLRMPGKPESAIGAVAEDGKVFLDPAFEQLGLPQELITEERDFQLSLIARRRDLFRAVRPPAAPAGRSIIVTDDGIATGLTMIAALDMVRTQGPYEVIVAVPVSRSDRLETIRQRCDEFLCLYNPPWFWSIGEAYEIFDPIGDDELAELLRPYAPKC